ncbi:MAG TPA: hypothetical protein VGF77_05225 [Allosphingosinicella sp.]|jgi:hypothetical protein
MAISGYMRAMPFDDKKFDAHAANGDVGGVALVASMAIDALMAAIKAISEGKDPAAHLAKAKEMSEELDQRFDDLTGYTKK